MGIDKMKVFVIFSAVVFLAGLCFYVTFRPPTEDAVESLPVTVFKADAPTDSSTATFPEVSAPIASKPPGQEDVSGLRSGDDPNNLPPENLTEGEIRSLIKKMEAERDRLRQTIDHKNKLRMEIQDQLFAREEAFLERYHESVAERGELAKVLKQKLPQDATLEEYQKIPEWHMGNELLNQEKALREQSKAEMRASIDRLNGLTEEIEELSRPDTGDRRPHR